MDKLSKIAKGLMLLAALWSLGAGAWIFFSPVTITTQTAINLAPNSSDVNPEPEIKIEQQSWLKAQGWWGVAILLIFAGLYAGAAGFFRPGRELAAGLLSALALLLTLLAGLSIGRAYLPAAIALTIAWVILGFGRLLGAGDQPISGKEAQ